jgi:hypothetical protein
MAYEAMFATDDRCFCDEPFVGEGYGQNDVRTSLSGFAKPVGTGPVRPVPGGTGPARYTNRSGSHPKTVPINSQAR